MTHNTGRKPGAIALGMFLAGVTGYVLFNDVLTQGAPINTGHALSAAALVTALAAFHMAWPCMKARALGSGAALVVLGLGATTYIVISSGARNAETAQAKVSVAIAANEARSRILDALDKANAELKAARVAKAKECATGRGKMCREAEDLLGMAELAARMASAVPVVAEVTINAGYAHAARVLEAAGFGFADDIEARLELLLPFLVVLIVELGTVTFLHVGLGSGAVPARVAVPVVVSPVEPDGTGVEPPVIPANDNVVEWVRAFRARNGRNPQIPELQREFPIPKTTAWRRIKGA